MSLSTKLNYFTKNKPTGEDWYCFQVPEELHFWFLNYQWANDGIEKYGVRPMRLKVHGVSEYSSEAHSFPRKRPLKLKCGPAVFGKKTVSGSTTHNYEFRVDSTKEINDALLELGQGPGYQIERFDILEMDVFNPDTGHILKATRHNPDGTGSSFYIVAFTIDGDEKLYPNIAIGNMMDWVGKFKENLAHCSNVSGMQKACAIEHKVPRRQIKTRKPAAPANKGRRNEC